MQISVREKAASFHNYAYRCKVINILNMFNSCWCITFFKDFLTRNKQYNPCLNSTTPTHETERQGHPSINTTWHRGRQCVRSTVVHICRPITATYLCVQRLTHGLLVTWREALQPTHTRDAFAARLHNRGHSTTMVSAFTTNQQV